MLNVNLCQIKDYVEVMARKERVKSFYPQTVSRKLSIPLELVVIELPKLVTEGCIELKYEIRCDELHIIKTTDNYMDYLGNELFCDICGEDIEISYSSIYPIYYITDEYKEFIKKNKKIM